MVELSRTDSARRRRRRVVSLVHLLTMLSVFAWGNDAWAQGRREANVAQAALDAGERAMQGGNFEAAVRAFLAADDEQRSMATLQKAWTAALRADVPLLTVKVAERVLSRADASNDLRSQARMAVATASDKLAQLELVCAEPNCMLELDGEFVPEGITYIAPGAHQVQLENRPETRLQVNCAARAVCRVKLPSETQGLEELSPVAEETPAASPPPAAPETERADVPPPVEETPEPPQTTQRTRAPMVLTAAAGGGALLFAALTTWSGVQALHARKLHETNPRAYDPDEVRSLARRTDYLLVGSVACAGTALIGAIWWANSKASAPSVDVSWLPGGMFATTTHRF